jgi:glutamate-1-semialdehyde 2,1-aminomutase/spore coat polysaccharide biosynthesis protein SpsF
MLAGSQLLLKIKILNNKSMYENSLAWHQKAKNLIPLGTQTYSKSFFNYTLGGTPLFIDRGEGSHVWDIDGNEYIDYPLSLGAITLGHNYPEVTKAVLDQLAKGTVFSLATTLEVELAEKLVSIMPAVEMVRYGKNGSDVTSAAIRLARAYTKRDIIACGGYHGWQDWYIGSTSRNLGVPEAVQALTKSFAYGNIDSLEAIFKENIGRVAAIILEPVDANGPDDVFLKQVRILADKYGALLIFDEVLSGFRHNLGGVDSYLDVKPDLICFGKGISNGFPLSVIGGQRKYMELLEDVFFSFTFGGETLSLRAALATIEVMEKNDVFTKTNHFGERLKNGYNEMAKSLGLDKLTMAKGYKSRYYNVFLAENGSEDLLLKSIFQQEMARLGVLFHSGNNICYSHSEADILKTQNAQRAALEVIKDGLENKNLASKLIGEPIKVVFR